MQRAGPVHAHHRTLRPGERRQRFLEAVDKRPHRRHKVRFHARAQQLDFPLVEDRDVQGREGVAGADDVTEAGEDVGWVHDLLLVAGIADVATDTSLAQLQEVQSRKAIEVGVKGNDAAPFELSEGGKVAVGPQVMRKLGPTR